MVKVAGVYLYLPVAGSIGLPFSTAIFSHTPYCFISVIICRIDPQVSALSVTAHTLFPFSEQDRLVANFITEACAVKRELIGNRTCDVHVTPAKLEIPMVPCNFIPVQPRLYKGKGSCHGIKILHCLFEGS